MFIRTVLFKCVILKKITSLNLTKMKGKKQKKYQLLSICFNPVYKYICVKFKLR